ncbi:SDR family NAD(P)-dependent oxidoreductase [Microbacterium suaedae]|uniref:SDR family NAD(P)-dependent oxidoreductase n=1 Tax=Microbacterium suaedae TaxID=2067813 RepID=UPI000DA19D0E|nr:SDR family oxidoreductase [Microbacterium suaedae]
MDLGIAGAVALVTGASGGIGRAVADALAREGCRLVLIDRAAPEPPASAEPGAVLALAADVTRDDEMRAAVAAAAERFDGVDLAVACAGISGPVGTTVDEVTVDEWRRVMDVNATGSFLLLRHVSPLLRRSRLAAAVLVASDSALVAAPGMVPYCASKAAVLQLARAASVDLAPEGVRVAALCPSVVDTAMSRGDLHLPDGFSGQSFPVLTPDEIAGTVAFLCSPWARAINGTALVSDFGYSARSAFPA